MTVQLFLTLLSMFTVTTSLVVEVIKKLLSNKENVSYTLIAIITGVIIGVGGCFLYYGVSGLAFTVKNVIYAVLMGFASGLTSTLGYDKVKTIIIELFGKEL